MAQVPTPPALLAASRVTHGGPPLRHDRSCAGRGCPACTGLTWAELYERDRDREESAREQQRMHDDHEHDWHTR